MITARMITTSMMQTCQYPNLTLPPQEHMSKNVSTKNYSQAANFLEQPRLDLFMALGFDENGMDGFRVEDKYKQMTSWGAIRQFIKKGQMISDSCVSINSTLQQKVSIPLLF